MQCVCPEPQGHVLEKTQRMSEILHNDKFSRRVVALVIDEAHCVVKW